MKRNARKWLRWLFTFALVLGLLSALGLTTLADGVEVTTEDALRNALLANDEATVTLGADITISAVLIVKGTKTLDLNGYGIKATATDENRFSVIRVIKAATLNLIDSGNTEHYYYLDENEKDLAHVVESTEDIYYAAAAADKRGSFTGGYLTGGTGSSFSTDTGIYYIGGGVQSYGTFNMSGGTIIGNACDNGGGVCCINQGKFTMTGGTILGNTVIDYGGGGVFIFDVGGTGCKFTMDGGTISYNTALGDPAVENDVVHGGGVFNFGGIFEMNGGAISYNNASSGGGGGVENYNYGTFTMSGGTISYNASARGGGVECFTVSTFNMSGGTIEHNTAAYYGGAMANYYNSTFNMSGGTISDNQAIYGGGVENGSGDDGDNSRFIMSGGTISYNTAIQLNNNYNTGFGGGVESSATFSMSGQAVISNNGARYGAGVVNYNGGTFTMSGGTISDNQAAARSGGVENGSGDDGDNSRFIMSGGTISNNKANSNGGVYNNGATFTMSGGTIERNEVNYNGGGVTNMVGTFTMSGEAAISNNVAKMNGGGVYSYGGTFTMNGGEITHNKANTRGGGVYINSGTVTMDGGTVGGNDALQGGGVYVDNTGVFTMSGGEIGGTAEGTANTASQGGGVFVMDGVMEVSGSVRVVGNKNQSSEINNVYLPEGYRISVTGALTDSARIGVTMQTPGLLTSGLKANDANAPLGSANNFLYDNGAYIISITSEGEAAARCSVSGSLDGSGKLVATVTAPKGSMLIAAAYESSGKMVDAESFELTAAMNAETHTFTDLETGTGYTYKLILIDVTTYAPLCDAWAKSN